MSARAELKSAGEGTDTAKITVNDFVLKAAVQAAVRVPKVNASFDGDAIVQYSDVNLAIAVAIEEGLVTPVIRAAQNKSLREISEAVKDLAHRARNKRMKPEEFQGGTFTVSNLGSYGIDYFLRHHQSAAGHSSFPSARSVRKPVWMIARRLFRRPADEHRHELRPSRDRWRARRRLPEGASASAGKSVAAAVVDVTLQDGGCVWCRKGGRSASVFRRAKPSQGAGAWLRSRFRAANLLGADDFA